MIDDFTFTCKVCKIIRVINMKSTFVLLFAILFSADGLQGQTGSFPLPTSDIRHLGGIVRFDTTQKNIYLVFTGHEYADGADVIIAALRKHSAKASFFFTGDFYRNRNFVPAIRQLHTDVHYLGAHSDKHLLYCTWEKRDSLLVTKEELTDDILNNYAAMKTFGISKKDAPYFMPPYEWYNQQISDWVAEFGLQIVNFTPGTSSNADYTTPEMPNYISSDSIYARILRYESTRSAGLNGFILLVHIGTSERRTDKFYSHLDRLMAELLRRGYSFRRL